MYNNSIKITYDAAKRRKTLEERGLDFEDASEVFAGETMDGPDDRWDYGESRIKTVGFLRGRMVIIIWTPRWGKHHIISMRKANDREQKKYRQRFSQS